jgi:D-alanyl-D-alanine carboxypeptidase/D-alanyl-D-alanine-endopeptidase (penicillin-binding protein 4)
MRNGDRMFKARSLLALAAFAAACRPATAPAPMSISSGSRAELRAFVDSMADAPEFSNAHWGILIVDPERRDTLYARNAGKLFMPASNMKIPTSATALTQLGPDYRFRTTFAARGTIANGTLDGDLLVIGRGDPSVSDHMLKDAMIPLRLIADSIAARGIKRITGRVLPYGDAFPGDVFGYGWTYADFEDSYSAPIDELLFNEGFSTALVRGAAQPGTPATITPGPARFPFRGSVMTVERRAGDSTRTTQVRTRKDSTTWQEIFSGQIAVNDTTTVEVTHHDPDQAYVSAFTEALTSRGIEVGGSVEASTGPIDTLATLSSPPLGEILKALMKPSQNQIAEMLFRTIALEKYGSGRPDSAAVAVRAQLAQWGVPANEAVIRDGSGLSRYDYITPRTIVRIFDAMHKSPHFQVYYDALPIAGVDGTIRNRMKGTPAENNVHAKTGSVALSRSLSGYVTTADGHMLIFSFLSNNWTVPTRAVERVQDAIAARLAGMRLR